MDSEPTPSRPGTTAPRQTRAQRAPKPMTRSRIENIALHHIERYPTSIAHLRRVLERRAERSRVALAAHHDERGGDRGGASSGRSASSGRGASSSRGAGDPAQHSEWIEAAIARLGELGLLDDRAYARALARRLRGRGSSRRQIEARLADKGIADEIRREALAGEGAAGSAGSAELEAAAAYARRRRLGPHRRDPEARTARRERDLAALARAGFSYAVAQRIIDADPAPEA